MSLGKKLFTGAKKVVLSEHFDIIEYTGDGTTPRSITGLSFQPDIIWIFQYHTSGLEDKIGCFSKLGTNASGYNYYFQIETDSDLATPSSTKFLGFLTNGFKVGANNSFNGSGNNYLAVCWKVNGNTANPDVNPDIGISLRTYTGNGSYRNMGHGLGTSNVMPIIKGTDSGYPWVTRPIGTSWTDYARISGAAGFLDDYWTWQDTSASSTSIRLGPREWVNYNTWEYIMWTLTPITGISAMGSYTGNGSSTDGPEINCGFQPSFVLLGTAKEGQYTETIFCTNRYQSSANNTNLKYTMLSGNSGWYNSSANFDFLSTGFKINSQFSTFNSNGDKYWYMAWADPDIVG